MAAWMHRNFRQSSAMVSKTVVTCMLGTTMLTAALGAADSAYAALPAEGTATAAVYGSGGQGTAAQLTDLEGSYAKKEILALAEAGVVSGYEDGTFAPTQGMSRAEMAKILVKAMGLAEDPSYAEKFTDIPADSWYKGHVGALLKAGITQGTSETAFSPGSSVSREELVVFFVRAFGLEKAAETYDGPDVFTDGASISPWALPHVHLAYGMGFIGGVANDDGSLRFDPRSQAERQALARLAYEYIGKKQDYVAKAKELVTAGQPAAPDAPKAEEPAAPVATTASGGSGGGGGGGGGSSSSKKTERALEQALASLAIGFASGDSEQNVSSSITLPATVVYKESGAKEKTVLVSWTSSNKDIVGTDGLVNRPAAGRPDAQVVLTASVQKGSSKASRNYTLTVKALTSPNPDPQPDPDPQPEPQPAGLIRSVKGINTVKAHSSDGLILTNFSVELSGQVEGAWNVPQSIRLGEQTYQVLLWQEGNTRQLIPVYFLDYLNEDRNLLFFELLQRFDEAGPVVSTGQKYTVELLSDEGKLIESKSFRVGLQPTALKAADFDSTPGVDGRDFTVTWNPSQWEEAELQQVYILPADTELDRSKHHPVAEFKDRTTSAWTGNTTTQDSLGQALAQKEYSVIVAAIHGEQDAVSTVLFAPDAVSTAPPAVESELYDDGRELSGRSESNAIVYLKDSNGWVVSEVQANESGRFHLQVPLFYMAAEGTVLEVSAKSPGKLESPGALVTLTSGTKSVIRGLEASIFEDGGRVRLPEDFNGVVNVFAGDGTVLAERYISYYEYEPYILLNQPWQTAKLKAGEKISVRIREQGRSASDPQFFEVRPVEGTSAKPSVMGTVNNAESWIDLELPDPWAAVTLKRHDGSLLWTGFNDGLGINGLLFNPGDSLLLTADEIGKYESEPVILEVISADRTKLGSVTGVVYEDGGTITGNTEPDWYATYQVRKSDGTINIPEVSTVSDGISSVSVRGSYQVGEQLTVTARATGKLQSEGHSLIVQKGSDAKTAVPVIENVYAGGYAVSGTAEPNSLVTVTRSNGQVTSGYADSFSGFFHVSAGRELLAADETLKVTADAPGKAASSTLEVKVRAVPQTPVPTVTVSVYNGSVTKLQVISLPDTEIELQDEQGNQLYWDMTGNSGEVVFDMDYVYPSVGNKLYVFARKYNLAESAPYVVNLGAVQASSTPNVSGVVYTDGYWLEGGAAPNSRIRLVSGGTAIAGSHADDEGGFALGHNGNDWLYAGEVVQVTSQEPYRSVSLPVDFVVQPVQGATEAPTVIGDVYANTNWFEVQTEPGAFVVLRDMENKVISENYADLEGRAELNLYRWMRNGNTFKLTSDAIGRTISDTVMIKVAPAPPTTKPYAVTSSVYADGGEVRGYTEAYAAVELKKTDGTVIASGTASYDGSFYLRTQPLQLTNGEFLSLIAKNWDKSASEAYSVTVQGVVYGQTAKPSVTGVVYEMGGSLRIEAGPRQWVRVYSETKGQLFIEWTGDYYYGWSRYVSLPNQPAGTKVYVYADAFGQAESEAVVYGVQPTVQTTKPTVTGIVYSLMNPVSVTLTEFTPGDTRIRIKRADGQLIAQEWANRSTLQIYPWYPLIEGETLYITAEDPYKKESDPFLVMVQGAPMTVTPSVYGSVYEDGGFVTGTGAQYSEVRIFRADNTLIATGSTGYYGSYSIDLTSYFFTPGEILLVDAQASGYKPSYKVSLNVLPVAGQTAKPTVNGTVYQSESYALYGYAVPYSKITVTREDGASFTARSGEYGYFSAYYPSNNWLVNVSHLKITADAYGKLASEPLIVPVVSMKTPAPGVTVSVYGSTYTLSGYMYQPTQLRVRDGFGLDLYNTVNGSFSWDISGYLIRGNQLMVTAQRNNYSVSDVVYLTLPSNSSSVGGDVYGGGGSSVSGSVYGFSTGGSTASSPSGPASSEEAYQAFAAAAVLPQRRAA
ncbi:Ig-like domain-containing protein [Paenibacillus sp. S-38]|uniref:Ig-like domain-containing protein n=1 Tax=Paenibacillus sp. S-38 TaxID=3416710 RepID=UPI003CEBF5A0